MRRHIVASLFADGSPAAMSAAAMIQKGVDRDLYAVALEPEERDAILAVLEDPPAGLEDFVGCSRGISATDQSEHSTSIARMQMTGVRVGTPLPRACRCAHCCFGPERDRPATSVRAEPKPGPERLVAPPSSGHEGSPGRARKYGASRRAVFTSAFFVPPVRRRLTSLRLGAVLGLLAGTSAALGLWAMAKALWEAVVDFMRRQASRSDQSQEAARIRGAAS